MSYWVAQVRPSEVGATTGKSRREHLSRLNSETVRPWRAERLREKVVAKVLFNPGHCLQTMGGKESEVL